MERSESRCDTITLDARLNGENEIRTKGPTTSRNQSKPHPSKLLYKPRPTPPPSNQNHHNQISPTAW